MHLPADSLLLAAEKSGGSPWGTVILFAVLIGLLYVVFIRPQRRRIKAATSLQTALHPGQQVMTASGLFGTVAAVEDDAVLIEVAPGVTTRWAKPAVGRIVTPAESLGLEEIEESGDPYERRHDIDLVDDDETRPDDTTPPEAPRRD